MKERAVNIVTEKQPTVMVGLGFPLEGDQWKSMESSNLGGGGLALW